MRIKTTLQSLCITIFSVIALVCVTSVGARADVLYSTNFATDPLYSGAVTGIADIPAGDWFGAQHGVLTQTFEYYYDTPTSQGEVFYTPQNRVSVTIFISGLSIPTADLTDVVAIEDDGTGSGNDQLALYIGGQWYLSQQSFRSVSSDGTNINNATTETFTFGPGALFAPFPTGGVTPTFPAGTYAALPSGTVVAAGIYNSYAGLKNTHGAPMQLFSFTVDGVPEPSSAALLGFGIVGIGLYGLRRHRSL